MPHKKAPPALTQIRAERKKYKRAVAKAENEKDKPRQTRLASGTGTSRRQLTPAEYERAFGRPMPEVLQPPPINLTRYLQSHPWWTRQETYRHRHPRRCTVCNCYEHMIGLQHLTYDRLEDEDDDDLIPLCRTHLKQFRRIDDRHRSRVTVESSWKIVNVMRLRLGLPSLT